MINTYATTFQVQLPLEHMPSPLCTGARIRYLVSWHNISLANRLLRMYLPRAGIHDKGVEDVQAPRPAISQGYYSQAWPPSPQWYHFTACP